jgi:dTDP-glucose 4,6-dehydratase
MNVLVTGGAGFIGSNFIRYALSAHPDWTILNFDKLTYAGNPASLEDVAGGARYAFARGDIADPVAVAGVLKQGTDAVINFAAETHVDRSIAGSTVFLQTNVIGVQVLLDAAKSAGVSTFLQISTDEVYGDLPPGEFARETDRLQPSSPYSASKAAGDLLALSYARTHGLPVLITRCTNNYGPYQYPEKLLPLFATNLLQKRTVPVYGDGKQVRDWLHVDDHCRAIDLVLAQGVRGEIYNIGANHAPEWTNLDVTRVILQTLDKDESAIEHVPDRPGHDRRYAVDTAKIEALGWRPTTLPEQGIRATTQWYRDHRAWWEPVISGEFQQYYARQYAQRNRNQKNGA